MLADLVLIAFFFFSSRRRHTRFDCDWSSDVCSSDLGVVPNSGYSRLNVTAASQAQIAPWLNSDVTMTYTYDNNDQVFKGTCGTISTCGDRKSTRLNSSHSQISYAVFCLKKKKNNKQTRTAKRHT